LLSDIPVEFTLSEGQQDEYELYLDLFDVLLDLHTDSTNIDSASAQSLMNLADYNGFLPGVYSRNILIANHLISYQEPVYLSDNPLKSTPISSSNKNNSNEKKQYLNVFPNPANTYFIIEYDLRDFYMPGIILICDQEGKLIKIISLNDKQNQKIIGIYLVSLYINNKLESVIKTIIY
jgi:hypothetical protein